MVGVLLSALVGVIACGPPPLALTQERIVLSGAELGLIGDFDGHGAVIVIVDGVPAHSTVVDGHRLRARVPALPHTGPVDVELLFADGTHELLPAALTVSAPGLQVE